MSFFDKLKFWKHEEAPADWMGELESAYPMGGGPAFPTGLPSGMSTGFGQPGPAEEPGSLTSMSAGGQATITPAAPPYQIIQPQPLYQQVQPPLNRDMEILSLKLDAIKNILDTINMRLERLEQMARGERPLHERELRF